MQFKWKLIVMHKLIQVDGILVSRMANKKIIQWAYIGGITYHKSPIVAPGILKTF